MAKAKSKAESKPKAKAQMIECWCGHTVKAVKGALQTRCPKCQRHYDFRTRFGVIEK